MPTNHTTVRIASYNILHNEANLQERYESLRKELLATQPDVIGFQEVFDGGWELLVEVMESLGYVHYFKNLNCELLYDPENPKWTGNSVFSKFPLRNSQNIEFPEVLTVLPYYKVPEAISTEVILPDGRHFLMIDFHGVWRAENEKLRYWQAEIINKFAEEYENHGLFTTLVGDFNANSTGQTIRYLTGAAPDRNGDFVYWVDAYAHKGSPEDYTTSSGALYWAQDTARRTGIIFPEELPDRRIDYILTKGWSYGRNGSPMSFGRMGTELTGTAAEPTDHYGIYSDLLVV